MSWQFGIPIVRYGGVGPATIWIPGRLASTWLSVALTTNEVASEPAKCGAADRMKCWAVQQQCAHCLAAVFWRHRRRLACCEAGWCLSQQLHVGLKFWRAVIFDPGSVTETRSLLLHAVQKFQFDHACFERERGERRKQISVRKWNKRKQKVYICVFNADTAKLCVSKKRTAELLQ